MERTTVVAVVEDFFQDHAEPLIGDVEQLTEWQRKVEELGLKGQQALCAVGEAGPKSPVPFMFMTPSIVKTMAVLCPRHVDVDAYDKEPIPMKILDRVALSIHEGYFDKIQVWYDDRGPDPLVVGIRGTASVFNWSGHLSVSGNGDMYLIGRWGAEKADFDVLKNKASKRWMAQEALRLREEVAKLPAAAATHFDSDLKETPCDLPL